MQPEQNNGPSIPQALRDLHQLLVEARGLHAQKLSLGPRGGGSYVLEIESDRGGESRELPLDKSAPLLRAFRTVVRGEGETPESAESTVTRRLPIAGGMDVTITYREHSVGHTVIVLFDGDDALSRAAFSPSRVYAARGALSKLDELLNEAHRWNAPHVLFVPSGDGMIACCRIPAQSGADDREFARLNRVETKHVRELIARMVNLPAAPADQVLSFEGSFDRVVGNAQYARSYRVEVHGEADGRMKLVLGPSAKRYGGGR
jgi:hypothetical protein